MGSYFSLHAMQMPLLSMPSFYFRKPHILDPTESIMGLIPHKVLTTGMMMLLTDSSESATR